MIPAVGEAELVKAITGSSDEGTTMPWNVVVVFTGVD